MQDLIKNIGRFFERHVEKIVLVIVAIACAVLFFKFVIFSPHQVAVDNRKLSPGQVDKVVLDKARELERSIDGVMAAAQKAPPYTSVLKGRIEPNHPLVVDLFPRGLPQGFQGLFRSPLSFVSEEMTIMPPKRTAIAGIRKYKLPPRIGEVTDVAVNHLRAAAWVPVEALTADMGYDKVEVEPNDVDLVTVEAKFDIASVYGRFNSYFNGEEVSRMEWRDPCLAQPVFAAVQLQRRQQLGDGAWSDWQEVPRSRAETYGEMFQVIDRVENLPAGGMDIRLMHFKRRPITMDLLQPSPYQIASADEDWFPPSYYDKFKSLQRKVDMEERRQEREQNRGEQTRTDGRGRTATGTQNTGPGGRYRSTTGGGGGDMYGGAGGVGGRRGRGGQTQADGYGGGYTDPTTRRRGGTAARGARGRGADEMGAYGGDMGYGYGPGADAAGKPTTNEVYNDLAAQLITYGTKLADLTEPVLIWHFDDTVQPGGTYEYRMRVGVFNPVAGTSQLVEQDLDKKNQVILWSEFSDVTQPVTIPNRMYFFAKDVQDPKRSATVEVARYCLGYWRSEDFEVKPGEVIGKQSKPKTDEKKRPGALGARITGPAYGPGGAYNNAPLGLGVTAPVGMPGTDDVVTPELIDYRTGNVLVDLVQVSDWGDVPNLRPRSYHEMLYTADGQRIEHMPVSTVNWPKDLLVAYQNVRREVAKVPEAFRTFKKGGLRSRVMPGGMDGGGYGEGMYPDMMYNPGGGGAYGY